MTNTFSIKAVGKVVKSGNESVLQIFPDYLEGLSGLRGFSHVIVLFWFDRNDSPEDRAVLKVHPRADSSNPLTGVFATRSPSRPNLIGISVCRINWIEDGKIGLQEIDAFDGSPIIDLKPYITESDCIPAASVPNWVKKKKPGME